MLMLFLYALMLTESDGYVDVVGDDGRSIGCLQIKKVMVREVNRILESRGIATRYTYNDRYSRKKSLEMAAIYFQHHFKGSTDYKRMALTWKWGKTGYWKHKDTTQSALYWERFVKKHAIVCKKKKASIQYLSI